MTKPLVATEVLAPDGVCVVFFRCCRVSGEKLSLWLVDNARTFRGDLLASQKPNSLDCDPQQFLNAIVQAFSQSTASSALVASETATTTATGDPQARFKFKWDAEDGTLTLVEQATQSGLAMKYASIHFKEIATSEEQATFWNDLLLRLVRNDLEMAEQLQSSDQRIEFLENQLAQQKELLEAAVDTKLRNENQLFERFAALLNSKKQEIGRLQRQLESQTVWNGGDGDETPNKPTKRKGKRPPLMSAPKTNLKTRKRRGRHMSSSESEGVSGNDSEQSATEEEEEEEEEEDGEAGEANNDMDMDEDETEKQNSSQSSPEQRLKRRRLTQDAVEAYQNVSSCRVSSVDDVLEDLDSMIKEEVEQNEQYQQKHGGELIRTSKRRRRIIPQRIQSSEQVTSEIKSTVKAEPAAQSTPKPAPKKQVESDEEDILDLLS